MKHFSKKIVVSLLATNVALSSVNASNALTGTPSVVSDNASVIVHANDPDTIIASIDQGAQQIKQALLAGAEAQDEVIRLIKENDALRSQTLRLKFQNVVLEAQQQEQKVENKSRWERFKSWISNLNPNVVVKSVFSALVTIGGILLMIFI